MMFEFEKDLQCEFEIRELVKNFQVEDKKVDCYAELMKTLFLKTSCQN